MRPSTPCVRILRRDADHNGYNRNFTIVDPGEQRTLMKRILKQLNLDPKKWNERSILGTISNAKNDLIDDVAYACPSWRYVYANRVPVLHGLPKELPSVGVG